MKIRDVGEQGLLQRLQRFCPAEIVGDDAAVLPLQPGYELVVTTDMLVDGVHFSDRTTSPQDTGWRAAAANLSDLAAMGASPLGITVGLAVTGDTEVSWVEQVYEGMSECLGQYNTPIVGGDVVRSPVVTLSITAFGEVTPNRIIRRSAAQPGYAIVVTGVHGSSRAGLELLLHPELGQNLKESDKKALIKAHQRPKPRLDVLPILWDILDNYQCPITNSQLPIAGMDSSDGLADAIVQICRASGVGAVVTRTHIPLSDSLLNFVSAEQALNWALYGGEDFELVLCLPLEFAQILVNKLDKKAAIVGTIKTESEVLLVDARGDYPDKIISLNQGFQHF
ncbi:thiamine-phosphate kinase [Microseira wollei]|uniref:Thiamine-monophosphate kinase n=1 Tax=Microseira wollei NIES-4236 TaxID=2530354 RepID=A0AAV3X794_9CYAN|nr:thiamine-phosphate kinase [Microseira wollei]GET37228.1 thiamine monophosphate kinase [Microseira wollei NIES-4236]